ncbi:MAG: type II toxin-antitoxin system VapC family toxin [Acidimicrobiales bacterium]
MIFVDTNVFMYAVGRQHPLRRDARRFFEASMRRQRPLVTSAEVQQELLHAYMPVGRMVTLDAALALTQSFGEVWAVESDDVTHARSLAERHRGLGARDLLHLACCQRRGVTEIKTFDRQLAAAFG